MRAWLTAFEDSPASNGGRGLKRNMLYQQDTLNSGFARQQWRAWIETNDLQRTRLMVGDSPASNGGRGLKPSDPTAVVRVFTIRPPAMAGVD